MSTTFFEIDLDLADPEARNKDSKTSQGRNLVTDFFEIIVLSDGTIEEIHKENQHGCVT